MPPIDAQFLDRLALNGDKALMAALAPELAAQLAPAGIDTPLRVAHFLAQACVETWNFTRLDENLNYRAGVIAETFPKLASRAAALEHKPEALANAAYAGENGNGDEASGDGWRYRGRGLFGLTGRFNYEWVGSLLKRNPAFARLDPIEEPDLIAAPKLAVASAIAFWSARDLNEAADADDCVRITRAINGGTNGLSDRLVCKHRALKLLEAV